MCMFPEQSAVNHGQYMDEVALLAGIGIGTDWLLPVRDWLLKPGAPGLAQEPEPWTSGRTKLSSPLAFSCHFWAVPGGAPNTVTSTGSDASALV